MLKSNGLLLKNNGSLVFFINWLILYAYNSKNICQNQLKLATQHKYINMYKKM